MATTVRWLRRRRVVAFDYTVSDNRGGTAHGQVSLTVHVIANVEVSTPNGANPLPPLAVEGGAGGVIAVWMEETSSGIDLRARRIGQWGPGGVLVSTIHGPKVGGYTVPAVSAVADGSGGAIIAWADYLKGVDADVYAQRTSTLSGRLRSADVYAQRISGDGVALWAAGGVPVCAAAGRAPLYEDDLDIASDGTGGAIVAWTAGQDPNGIILGQRLASSDGTALWGPCGKTVSDGPTGLCNPAIVPDRAGGAVIVSRSLSTGAIVAQRIDADGAPLWGASKVVVDALGWEHVVVSDGASGAIVAFDSGDEVRAQRIGAGGDVLWSAGGVPLSTATGARRHPTIAPDGAGGAVVAWWDDRQGNSAGPTIYAQRAGPDGSVLWAPEGVLVCGTPVVQATRGTAVIPDGAGGAILGWVDIRDGAEDGNDFAQHISGGGLATWTADGVHVTDAPGYQGSPKGISDGAGGAWLVFIDGRTNQYRISAQHVMADGSVP